MAANNAEEVFETQEEKVATTTAPSSVQDEGLTRPRIMRRQSSFHQAPTEVEVAVFENGPPARHLLELVHSESLDAAQEAAKNSKVGCEKRSFFSV